jgi:predicted lipid-binding transport protein (Tim44 family)
MRFTYFLIPSSKSYRLLLLSPFAESILEIVLLAKMTPPAPPPAPTPTAPESEKPGIVKIVSPETVSAQAAVAVSTPVSATPAQSPKRRNWKAVALAAGATAGAYMGGLAGAGLFPGLFGAAAGAAAGYGFHHFREKILQRKRTA